MAELRPTQIGANMLAGTQGAQQIQDSRQMNQMRGMQMQQSAAEQQRDSQFRNALSTYMTDGSNGLAALYATDPERAMKVEQFSAQKNQLARTQEVEQAKQSYAQAQGVLASEAPATYMRILIPNVVDQWSQQSGKSPDDMTDEEATALAEKVAALAGSKAGILPEYTNPEAAQVGGQDRFVQFEKTTGRQRTLGGASPRPQKPLVSVGIGEEKAEAKKVGEGMGEMYVELQKTGAAAPMKLGKLDRMEQLAEGVNTGKLQPAITQVAAVAESLGFKIDAKLGPKQALEALTNEMALELRNPAGGAGMPGAMSDSDREFLMTLPPGLSKTREGNRLIIQTARAVAKRDQEVAKLARAYRKKNGSLDEGFYDELADFSAANPLFGTRGTPVTTPDGWIVTEKN